MHYYLRKQLSPQESNMDSFQQNRVDQLRRKYLLVRTSVHFREEKFNDSQIET